MTLTDLLVSIAVGGVLLGSTAMLLDQGQRAYATGAARVEAQQSVRLALERMAVEIRGAGRSEGWSAFDAISVTEPTRLTIQHDLNGDRVIAGNGETVTYLLRGTTLRRDAGGGAQPVVEGVRSLHFRYLDGRRRETMAPDEVRSVEISITAGPLRPAIGRRTDVTATAMTEVRLRNR